MLLLLRGLIRASIYSRKRPRVLQSSIFNEIIRTMRVTTYDLEPELGGEVGEKGKCCPGF
jgi:hypothetical protein